MELTELLGTVVTVRTVTGEEIIAKLTEYADRKGLITVENPLVVLLDENGDVMTLPYSLTGVNHRVVFNTRNVFSITPASEVSAEDYNFQFDK